MTTPAESTPGGNVYFVDSESAAEMGRMLDMDRVFTHRLRNPKLMVKFQK